MSHPPLTKTQRDVLLTVRYEPRIARWNHRTLDYLRSLGLVSVEHTAVRGGLPAGNSQWSITDLGIDVYAAPKGTPVPLMRLADLRG
jgi:hypothetical protein